MNLLLVCLQSACKEPIRAYVDIVSGKSWYIYSASVKGDLWDNTISVVKISRSFRGLSLGEKRNRGNRSGDEANEGMGEVQ